MTVKLTFIYLNENREITNIYSEKVILNNGMLERNKLIDYIRKYSTHHGVRYMPYSILKYEFNLKLQELEEFVSSFAQGNKRYSFSQIIRHIDTISFSNMDSVFASLNELLFLFYPKLQTTCGITKRIFITPPKNKTRRKTT